MQCPFCNADQDKVIDSRPTDGGRCIRRRRECLACGRRFSTYERVQEKVRLQVIKRDASRVPYDRAKVREALRQATYKRPVSVERLDQIVDEVEEFLTATHEKEVSSQAIGECIAGILRKVDTVAYVRFASVYRSFEDVGEFIEEAQDVIENPSADIPGQGTLFDETETNE